MNQTSDFSPSLVKMGLNFLEIVKVRNLIVHLIGIGKRLEGEFHSEKDEAKKHEMDMNFTRVLEYYSETFAKEKSRYDQNSPLDMIKINIYQHAFDIIESYGSFISGERQVEDIGFLLVQLNAYLVEFDKLLSEYGKEAIILGMVNYLMDFTEGGMKNINEFIDRAGWDERRTGMTKFLEGYLNKLTSWKTQLTDKHDAPLIEAIDLCVGVTEKYIETLKVESKTDKDFLDSCRKSTAEALNKVIAYQRDNQKLKRIGIAEYLIKTGMEIKNINSSGIDSEDKEKHFKLIHEILLKESHRIEEKIKEQEENKIKDEEVAEVFQPIERAATDALGKAREIIDNYIKFIDSDRNTDLINDSLGIAIRIDNNLEDGMNRLDMIQFLIPSPVVGEA